MMVATWISLKWGFNTMDSHDIRTARELVDFLYDQYGARITKPAKEREPVKLLSAAEAGEKIKTIGEVISK
jgi:hypothetical protein